MKKGDLLGVSWVDRAQVSFLSTNASSGTTNGAVRHGRHGEHREVPNVAIIYNGGMQGVDCNDQLVDQYASELKTNKLWRKVVFHLIDRCAATNSYIMYKHHNENPLEHHNFLVQVVEGLVGNYQEPKKRPGRKAIAQSRRLTERHFLEPISGKNRRDCGVPIVKQSEFAFPMNARTVTLGCVPWGVCHWVCAMLQNLAHGTAATCPTSLVTVTQSGCPPEQVPLIHNKLIKRFFITF
ncbi:PiggyBac transposable element-derived protein 4 [Nymphon striatum]|nr:PiggyBac transposable element-derived protein 4 [Nymphon striatum]